MASSPSTSPRMWRKTLPATETKRLPVLTHLRPHGAIHLGRPLSGRECLRLEQHRRAPRATRRVTRCPAWPPIHAASRHLHLHRRGRGPEPHLHGDRQGRQHRPGDDQPTSTSTRPRRPSPPRRRRPRTANGWHNTDVTVTFAGTDALSDIAACQAPTVLSTEGAGQSASGSCTDKAGNTGQATATGINIDKTAPTISASRSPAANASGWNNTDVTASYTASDALSGLAADSAATGTFTFTAEGAGQSHTFTVTDLAGNTAQADDRRRQHRQDGADGDRHAGAGRERQRLEQHRRHRDLRRDRCALGHRHLPGGDRAEHRGRRAVGHRAAARTRPATPPRRPPSGINIDKTAPTISASRAPARECLRLEQHRRDRELHGE